MHIKCFFQNSKHPFHLSTETEPPQTFHTPQNPLVNQQQKFNPAVRGGYTKMGRNKGRRRGCASSFRQSGETGPHDISIAPLNQVVPVGLHNLSKRFRPKLSTIRALSMGTKFITRWKFEKRNNAFIFKRSSNW